ncbi:MAG: hypothetical protein AAF734_08665, partial [Bacteroidota bacterium]
MILFEYDVFRETGFDEAQRVQFKRYLDEQWQQALFWQEGATTKQQFLQWEGSAIRANNYVGQLCHPTLQVTILPKFLKEQLVTPAAFFDNLSHYISYSDYVPVRGVAFTTAAQPVTLPSFQSFYLYWFLVWINDLLQVQAFHQFEEKVYTTPYLKGKLKVTPYLQKNVTKGRWQLFQVQGQRFLYDNLLNRLLKYTLHTCVAQATHRPTATLAQALLAKLEEVRLVACTPQDCLKVRLNPYYARYQVVVDFCRYLLQSQQLQQGQGSALGVSFLLPMERIFEMFLSQLIALHFPNKRPQLQSEQYLARSAGKPVFSLRNDVYLAAPNWVIDFKYKLLNPQSRTLGVAAQDIY